MDDISCKKSINQLPISYEEHKIISCKTVESVDYTVIDVNTAFEKPICLSRDKVEGKKVIEVLSDITQGKFDRIEYYGEIGLTEISKQLEQEQIKADKIFEEKNWVKFKISFMETTGFDIEEMEEIFLDFEVTLKDSIEELEEAIKKEAFEEIHIIGHKLKGTSANLRVSSIAELGEKLDYNAKNNDIENCIKIFEALKKESKNNK